LVLDHPSLSVLAHHQLRGRRPTDLSADLVRRQPVDHTGRALDGVHLGTGRCRVVLDRDRPGVVGGIPVLYAHQGSKILVVGLDPKTGAQRWAAAATTAEVVPGISLDVHSLGDLVAFLAPGDEPTEGRVTLLDPRTGKQVAQSGSRLYTSYPSTCEEDASSVCMSALEGQLRFGRGMTDAVTVPGGDLQSVQGLGDHGLVRYTADGVQRVGVRRGTAMVWQRTEAELFGPAYSTNGGWTWRFDAPSGLLVGTVGPDLSDPLPARVPLNRVSLSLGVRATTGEVVWRQENMDHFCDVDVTGSAGSTRSTGATKPWLACVWSGGDVVIDSATGPARDERPMADLVKVNPATGAILWRAPIGAVSVRGEDTRPTMGLTGTSSVVVATPGGLSEVDVASGAMTRNTQAEVWTSQSVDFDSDIPWRLGGKTRFERHGEVDVASRAGGPVTAITAPVPPAIGERLGSLTVVTTPAGVTAYRSS